MPASPLTVLFVKSPQSQKNICIGQQFANENTKSTKRKSIIMNKTMIFDFFYKIINKIRFLFLY